MNGWIGLSINGMNLSLVVLKPALHVVSPASIADAMGEEIGVNK